MEKVFNFK